MKKIVFSHGRLGIDNKKRVWGGGGCFRWPYSSYYQASKTKPEVGVECRGEVKTTDFDQIDEKRSPVTEKNTTKRIHI